MMQCAICRTVHAVLQFSARLSGTYCDNCRETLASTPGVTSTVTGGPAPVTGGLAVRDGIEAVRAEWRALRRDLGKLDNKQLEARLAYFERVLCQLEDAFDVLQELENVGE